MMASAGYPWTVVPAERRGDTMAALERASVEGRIASFADFIGGLVAGE
jgi:hypothetical protein